MGRISIERHTGWIGQLRGIEIYIDGEKHGIINHGETQDYVVKNGKHEVYAKIGWERSQKIELNTDENEITILKLTKYKYGTLILLIIFGLQALLILGKDTLNFELKHYLILSTIIILHPIYHIMKKRTVVLTEIDKKLTATSKKPKNNKRNFFIGMVVGALLFYIFKEFIFPMIN